MSAHTIIASHGDVTVAAFIDLPGEAWVTAPLDSDDASDLTAALKDAAAAGYTHITDQWLDVDPNSGDTRQFYRLGCR